MPPYQVTPGTALMAVGLYLIAGVIAYAASTIQRQDLRDAVRRSRRYQTPLKKGFRFRQHAKIKAISGATFLVCAAIINVITYGAAHGYNDRGRYVTSTEAAQAFGLESGVAYPLVLGDRVGGANGSINIDINRGFFTTRATVSASMTPGSAVSVSFVHQDKSYVLEIPVARSTFIQQANAEPTVALHLNKVEPSYYGVTVVDGSRPCNEVIKTAVLMCDRLIISTPQVDESTLRRGLAKLISEEDVLDSATFVVTPEMYNKIVGTSG